MNDIRVLNGIPELPKDSVLSEVFEYCRKKLHTPDKIIFWSVIAYLGASLKDFMFFDFASKYVFPNIPMLIIAPSGIGKTSSCNLLDRIFEGELPYKIPENCTSESFFKNFAKNGTKTALTTSCMWQVPEMADIFGKKDYQSGIVPRITRLLDNPKNMTVSRMVDVDIVIENIAVLNWICGSTYQWFIDYCEKGTSTGGFLPRLATIFCDDDPRYTPYPTRDINYEKYLGSKIRECILKAPLGCQEFSKEIEEVRYSFYEDLKRCKDDDTRVFIARQFETFAKIFMILSVFLRNFHTSSALITLAKKCSKLLLDNTLSLHRTIKMRNILPDSKKTVNTLYTKLRKNIGKDLNYIDILKSVRISSKELKPVLDFLKEYDVIDWDGKVGVNGHIVVMQDPEKFMDEFYNGIHLDGVEEVQSVC